MNLNVQVVNDIEQADMIIILGDYSNFSKNKVYDIYLDKYDNMVLMNNDLDYDNRPLIDYRENILLSVNAKVI